MEAPDAPGEQEIPVPDLSSWLPDPVIVIDAVGDVRWCNPAAERVLQRRLRDVCGTSGLALVHPDDQEFAALSLVSVRGKSVGTPVELRLSVASEWRRFEVVGAPLPTGEIVMTLRDLTERGRWTFGYDHERLPAIIDAASALTLVTTDHGRIEASSAALARVLGLDPELVVGSDLEDLVVERHRPELRNALERALEAASTSSHPTRIEMDFVHGGGTLMPFELSIACIETGGLVISGHDLRQLRTAREALAASERRFRSLIENASDVVTLMDPGGVVLYDSPSSERVLGYTLGERLGSNGMELIHPGDARAVSELLASVVTTGEPARDFETRVRRKDGAYIWVEASAANLLEEPTVEAIVVNFRDVTEKKRLQDELSRQAFHDSLTGLANRVLLRHRLEHALAQRHNGTCVALLILDLDDFKTANDALGHGAGDEILRETAVRLTSVLRPGDTAARLGGDEFAILLPAVSGARAAADVGRRIRDAIARPYEVAGGHVSISASIGVVTAVGNEDPEELLRNADLAMYRSKRAGNREVALYDPALLAAASERLALLEDLRAAIGTQAFVPEYQPIIELDSGRVMGVEALARWEHADGRVLLPDAFIPLAEEMRMTDVIGRGMLMQACADMARWRAELGDAAPAYVAVNIAADHMGSKVIVDDVLTALRAAALPPGCLTLEVTETAFLERTGTVSRTLASLKAVGVGIALDDFGTGYSSLSYLDRFPVDVVKLDRSFIRRLSNHAVEERPLVAAMIKLTSSLGFTVVAEGVEDERQADRLRRLGCDAAQGHYFAAALREPKLRELLGQLRDGAGVA